MPVGLRSRVPAKITSSMREPRRDLADCSPSTHEMASEILDLPQPLGPTMAAIPSPWNFSSVRSQKDLNPRICSFLSLSKAHSFVRYCSPAGNCVGWCTPRNCAGTCVLTTQVPPLAAQYDAVP